MNKIIHYFYDDIEIWKKDSSNVFRMCYFSWKKFCPDYEIKLWHTNMPEFQEMLSNSRFLRECYKRGWWAFVADYVRYYALYNYGGVYLDTDVQVLKSFDDYLGEPFFCSIEGDIMCGENIPEPAIIGGDKGHDIFKRVLDLYNSDEIFRINYPIANRILSKVLKEATGFKRISYNLENETHDVMQYYDDKKFISKIEDINLYKSQKIYQNDELRVKIYPSEYFCPTWDVFKENAITEKTVCIHWNQSSWWKMRNKLRILEALRYDNVVKRFFYTNTERIAKILTCFMLNKEKRRKKRIKILQFLNNKFEKYKND